MGLSYILEMLMMVVRGFLANSKKAAPYAKWLIRIRDYLLILFPQEMYPSWATEDVALQNTKPQAVPIDSVKKAAKELGFSLPFLK